ncbi:hypothetical protein [Limimaricola sp. AA108-03]|uniref:hypothetical protein n=1 Tax=Limimaricola sp. AA108-03 TaxID=3425945 RepID=UPI003D77DDB8
MNEYYRQLITEKLEMLAPASRFNLRELLGHEWPNDAGAARKLGRDFRAQIADFHGIADEGRDNENLRWYRKQ